MKSEVHKPSEFKKEIQKLDIRELKKAIVLNEVIGKPLALRKGSGRI